MQTPFFAAASILLDFGLLSPPRSKTVVRTHSMTNNMPVYYMIQYIVAYTLYTQKTA